MNPADQLLGCGVHKSVQALEVGIRRCNQDPRPFTWTETAEEILEAPSSPRSLRMPREKNTNLHREPQVRDTSEIR